MVLERDDWPAVDALLRAALDQPTGTRLAWLDEACVGDPALRDRVAQLVRLAEAEGDGLRPGGAMREVGEVDLTQTAGAEESAENTQLMPGHQLGRYEIRALLGAGGMGRVYRALDPMLGREVAIKALGQAFRADSASLRRFEREARLLATLSHPNIAAIYGFEMLQGAPYLILERVEGGTLIQRLRRGPVPPGDAVAIAIQVAEGLAEAHAKGVIHRDLKPSNVMLTADGRVKLVDFGLAKRTDRQDGDVDAVNPTTAAGAILGTAPYMSPEQIHGDDVDTRTDVWAFGCLLYEMLVGRAPFQGRSVPEVLVAVLRDEPDWSALPAEVPPPVRQLLQRCLRKDPRARLQHIGDARLELVELGSAGPAEAQARRFFSRPLPWMVLAALALSVAAASVWRPGRPAPTPRSARLSLDLPSGVTLTDDYPAPFAIAPAGSPLALTANEADTTRLYLRGLDDLGLRAIAGTDGARQPFFSPDGRWVGFFAERKLLKVAVEGGPVLPISDVGTNPRGAAWAPDGTIVFTPSQSSGLVRVSEGGGSPAPLTTLDTRRGEYSHRWPEIFPGGRWVLFTAIAEETFSFDEARLAAVSLDTGEVRTILEGAAYGRFTGGGELAFVRAGRVYSVPFDAFRLEARGAPVVMLDGVRYDPQNGGTHLATSASGVLVYSPGVPSSPDRYLSWLHADGRLARLVDTPRMFRDPRLSPDGQRVAVVISTSAGSDLWLVDENGTMTQLSFGLSPHRPTWSPDGKRITVGAEQNGNWRLLSLAADGKGDAQLLMEGPHRTYPNAWSADGRYLVLQGQRPQTGWDLLFLEVDRAGGPQGAAQPLAVSPFHESNAALSPDSRWVAYESDEVDGLVQAYVRSFPDGGHKVRVSGAGARWPSWGGGHKLYYWDTSRQTLHVAHSREVGGSLRVEDGRLSWDDGGRRPGPLARVVVRVSGARFDVHPTADDRFLVLETSATAVSPSYARPVIVLGRTAPAER